jgi:hypothetical protein
MLEIKKSKKGVDFDTYDYVCEDVQKFYELLPFLLPKIEGRWSVMLIEPKLQDIRVFLDTSLLPSFIDLTITMEPSQLSQLYLERPNLVEKEKSNWDVYLDMISQWDVPIEVKAMRELYWRKGPKEQDLREAMDVLRGYMIVTMKEINKHFVRKNRTYANQVVKDFLLGNYPRAWKALTALEFEIGTTVAFYALRKSIRHICEEKSKYLQNQETREWVVEKVDGYTILLLFWLFEEATGPAQLYLIFSMFERRQTPCSLRVKNAMCLQL